MNNIINIESKHTPKNTAQQAQIGHALYITGPSQIRRLPRAVAPSHKPWQRPSKFLGATLETKERPRGEINNSATVRKKYGIVKKMQLHFSYRRLQEVKVQSVRDTQRY